MHTFLITLAPSGVTVGRQVWRLLLVTAVLASVMLTGCNSSGKPTQNAQYQLVIGAAVSANADQGNTQARVSLIQSGQTTAAGPVLLNDDTLVGSGTTYQRQYGATAGFAGAIHTLKFMDGEQVVTRLNVIVPSVPGFAIVNPANRIYTGGQNVTVSISPLASGADGHVLAAVKANQAYTGQGYVSAPVGSASGVLPPSAFQVGGAGTLDTGKYYIYVYAYSGMPGGAGVTNVPTSIPGTLGGQNLATSTASGSYGSLVVSRRDSLFVRIQP